LELTTYLIAPDGIAQIRPINPSAANQQMNQILYHWSLGLRRPFSITSRTGLAYLFTLATADPEDAQNKAKEIARNVYEGDGFNHPGELGYADGVYLRRCYPTFDALWDAGINQFRGLATTLYAPIIEAAAE
jgi:exodeoxyribonuclease V gamma subunit